MGATFFGRTWDDSIAQYARSHQHPFNRLCHTLGIPLIVLSLAVAAAAVALPSLWGAALGLFAAGWALQFIGHAVEGRPPEFFHDWRFLFVGLRWWLAKMRGRLPR